MSIYSNKKTEDEVKEATVVQDSAPKAEPALEKVEDAKIVEEVLAEAPADSKVVKPVDKVDTGAAKVQATALKPGEVFGNVKTINGLNLRVKPNTKAAVLKVLKDGELITIDTSYTDPTWYKVKSYDNKRGYAMKKYIVLQ